MAEAMSYMAGSELPLVLINVMRGGPGLGSIGAVAGRLLPGDQGPRPRRLPRPGPRAVVDRRGGRARRRRLRARRALPDAGHDPRRRRHRPGDGAGRARSTGRPPRTPADWALTGADGRPPRVVRSLHLQPEDLEAHNTTLQAKFATIAEREVRWAGEDLDDAEIAIVAYGTAARVARTAIERAREHGLPAGLFRPITLWPFPSAALAGARPARCAPSSSSSCPPGRWSRTSGSRSRAGRRSSSTAGPAAWSRRPARCVDVLRRAWAPRRRRRVRPAGPGSTRAATRRARPAEPDRARRMGRRGPAHRRSARERPDLVRPAARRTVRRCRPDGRSATDHLRAPGLADRSRHPLLPGLRPRHRPSPGRRAARRDGPRARGRSASPRSAAASSPTTTSPSTSSSRPTAARRPSRPASAGSGPTRSSSPTRATATSPRSARPRSSTRRPAASGSASSSSTTASTG